MKSVRLHDPLDIRFEEVPDAPKPGAGEVRLTVAYAGICGSDIHNYKTGQWISRRPSIAGHEFSGVVDAIGEGVLSVAVGDLAVADSRDYCGKCANCLSGNHHFCSNLGFVGESIDGGFADYAILPEHLVLKCTPETPLDIAALAEPLAVALHALNRIHIKPEEPLLVIGCGPIGALIAVASDILGDRALLICDQNKARVSITAAASGGQAVDLAAFDQFANATGSTVRHVIDTTGSVKLISHLVENLSGATLGLVGIGSGSFPFDPVGAVERELTIAGCHAFKDELPQAAGLLTSFPERFAPLIGKRITLEDTPAEYAQIADGKATGIKTLIEIGKHG